MGSSVPLRRILVGVDGSPGGQRALAWATARAVDVGAELVVLHVLTYSTELRRDLALPDLITTWRRALDRRLREEWAAPARAAGVAAVSCELVEDDTAAAGVLAAADLVGADLIVLGARGRGSLAGRLLGATTYKVSHAAHTPVVVVPQDWQPAAA